MATTGIGLAKPVSDRGLAERRFRTLLVLGTLTSAISFIDRSVLNMLAEPIKRDLGLSDTQLGLLTGFAFALFYSVAGVPIARHVDRPSTDRPRVIAVCMTLWSAMTLFSGFALNFVQLALARALVAIGESGPGPAILTLINHQVAPAKRSRTFSIYALGVPLGTLLGLVLGGVLVDRIGWRMTFVAVGLPGLLVAPLIWFFMHEPRRTQATQVGAVQPALRDNLRAIVRSPTLLWLVGAASFGGFISIGLPAWTGVYLIRVLELTPSHAGLILGLVFGIGGGIGTFMGGLLADRLGATDPGRGLLVPGAGLLVGVPAAVAAFSTGDWRVFTACFAVVVIGASAYLGPLFSIIQLIVSERYRATTIVIVVLLINLIGAGPPS